MADVPSERLAEEAVEKLRRKDFFEEVNAGFARLKADLDAWAEEQVERRLSEATLCDGQQDE